ncbi:hypothetical protein N836_12355 [Leptolyngbya sp. Heron Island J]|nr:hypothetical protein N836_12355 [Leptolyngbya sp. Heron Island J]
MSVAATISVFSLLTLATTAPNLLLSERGSGRIQTEHMERGSGRIGTEQTYRGSGRFNHDTVDQAYRGSGRLSA